MPDIGTICDATRRIAFDVAKAAQQSGVAVIIDNESLMQRIEDNFWHPHYRSYKRSNYLIEMDAEG